MTARRPEFHAPSQTWHWWSSPAGDPSWEDDVAQAVPIEVHWTLDKNGLGGRCWNAHFEALPGFAPFLWALSDQRLWLRRPEGTWVASLPTIKKGDYIALCERHRQLAAGYRGGSLVFPEHESPQWHIDDSPVDVRSHDRNMFSTVMVDGQPMLKNHPAITSRRDLVPTIHLALWSASGPLHFRIGQGVFREGIEPALVITLPNGVNVAEPMNRNPLLPLMIKRQRALAVMGDDLWEPQHQQVIEMATFDAASV